MTIEDQPMPSPQDSEKPNIAELVAQDHLERMRIGTERYGTPLQGFNGRNPLVDAYQEALDLCQYLRQAIWEQENEKRPFDLSNYPSEFPGEFKLGQVVVADGTKGMERGR